jgi:hypothetical protein
MTTDIFLSNAEGNTPLQLIGSQSGLPGRVKGGE